MAKGSELKIVDHKKELELRGLVTIGNNLELQSRLRKAMEVEGINVDEHDFDIDVEETLTKVKEKDRAPQPVATVNTNAILAAISEQFQIQKGYMASQLEEKLEAQKGSTSSPSGVIK